MRFSGQQQMAPQQMVSQPNQQQMGYPHQNHNQIQPQPAPQANSQISHTAKWHIPQSAQQQPNGRSTQSNI